MSELVTTEKVKRLVLAASMAALMLSTPIIMPMIYLIGSAAGWWQQNFYANVICMAFNPAVDFIDHFTDGVISGAITSGLAALGLPETVTLPGWVPLFGGLTVTTGGLVLGIWTLGCM
ncbi:hypothetical protein JCM16161A_13710 [Vulcanisaeta sp. JCM 16161]